MSSKKRSIMRPTVVNVSGQSQQLGTRVATLQSRVARQRQELRALKSARSPQTPALRRSAGDREGRWNLGLNDLSIGPLRLGSISGGSGDAPLRAPKRLMESDTVGVASRTENIQVIRPVMSREISPDGTFLDVWCGTEYLTAIGSAATTGNAPGDVLFSFPINPSNFARTRIVQEAPLYQRYRFRSLTFHYQPIANATVSGQLIGFGDYDVDNPITVNTPDNVSIAAAHLGNEICQVWEYRDFPFGVVDSYTTLYTSLEHATDNRLVYQGQYYLIANSDLAASLPLGNIYVSYEIEFSIPKLQLLSSMESVPFLVSETYSASLTSGNLFGTGVAAKFLSITNDLALGSRSFVSASDTVVFSDIPNGRYMVTFLVQNTVTWTAAAGSVALGYVLVDGTEVAHQQYNFTSVSTAGQSNAIITYVATIDVTAGSLAFALFQTLGTGITVVTPSVTVLLINRIGSLTVVEGRPKTWVITPARSVRYSNQLQQKLVSFQARVEKDRLEQAARDRESKSDEGGRKPFPPPDMESEGRSQELSSYGTEPTAGLERARQVFAACPPYNNSPIPTRSWDGVLVRQGMAGP